MLFFIGLSVSRTKSEIGGLRIRTLVIRARTSSPRALTNTERDGTRPLLCSSSIVSIAEGGCWMERVCEGGRTGGWSDGWVGCPRRQMTRRGGASYPQGPPRTPSARGFSARVHHVATSLKVRERLSRFERGHGLRGLTRVPSLGPPRRTAPRHVGVGRAATRSVGSAGSVGPVGFAPRPSAP